jgi:hypothetical protein
MTLREARNVWLSPETCAGSWIGAAGSLSQGPEGGKAMAATGFALTQCLVMRIDQGDFGSLVIRI